MDDATQVANPPRGELTRRQKLQTTGYAALGGSLAGILPGAAAAQTGDEFDTNAAFGTFMADLGQTAADSREHSSHLRFASELSSWEAGKGAENSTDDKLTFTISKDIAYAGKPAKGAGALKMPHAHASVTWAGFARPEV